MITLNKEQVKRLHKRILDNTGGLDGVLFKLFAHFINDVLNRRVARLERGELLQIRFDDILMTLELASTTARTPRDRPFVMHFR